MINLAIISSLDFLVYISFRCSIYFGLHQDIEHVNEKKLSNVNERAYVRYTGRILT